VNVDKIKIALAGNPNAGKTSIFNGLTGSRQHVGNYPGVTVEIKDGKSKHDHVMIQDLPGTYSLTPYSEEERVAQQLLWKDAPKAIINVVDSSNLERNLYLTLQLKELGLPLILALNMSDIAKNKGIQIDSAKLTALLGNEIVETIGNKKSGLDDLLEKAIKISSKTFISNTDHLGEDLNSILDSIEKELSSFNIKGSKRWLALKLLENDKTVISELNNPAIAKKVSEYRTEIENTKKQNIETLLANLRYDYIDQLCRKTVKSLTVSKKSVTEIIDTIVMNRVLGIPIFLGLMYLVFQLTFAIGEPMMGWIESLFGLLTDSINGLWSEGSESLLRSLIVDGVIGGVGGVLVFLPNILLLFLAISLLEDTGYMARAAFIMDRLMNKIGLHGKSFIPMLIGFGCSVPAIMATRTMDNKRDRLVTMLVVPLMSCGARLPIYALIIPAFFVKEWQAPMLWIIYITGILLAIICAKLLRITLFKGESVPFIMEMPNYHRPTIKGIFIHMWERGKLYVQKAGTIILGLSVLIWVLSTFPQLPKNRVADFDQMRSVIETRDTTNLSQENKEQMLAEIDNFQSEAAIENSYAGKIGKFIEPALRPLGFDWKIGTSLVGAFAAKEVFVSTLGVVFSVGKADEESESLREKLKDNYSPLTALCIMLFCLISAPCMATIAVTKRESNSWIWAMFQLIGLTILAYLITLIVYQGGLLLGL
jgi:ferrous iron transport protein B